MSSPASYRPQLMHDLSGRVALVTGGGTGIGLMSAQGLAACGAKVYITGRRLDLLEKVSAAWDKQIGGEILPLQMDVTDKESILKVKAYIEEKEGKLHVLVNNAGQLGPTSPFLNDKEAPENKTAESLGTALFNCQSFESWSSHFSVNLASIFFVTTAFLGLLAKGSEDIPGYWSSVINITSISGIIKLAQNHFCYNSVKAAASHLTQLLSTEIGLKNIPVRVNAIAPGAYESEITLAEITPDNVDKIGQNLLPLPARRAGTGQEMAGTIVYLASRAGGYAHGQEIVIDGGYTAVNPSRA